MQFSTLQIVNYIFYASVVFVVFVVLKSFFIEVLPFYLFCRSSVLYLVATKLSGSVSTFLLSPEIG